MKNVNGVMSFARRARCSGQFLVTGLAFLVGACSSEDVPVSPPQTWKGINVTMESRPPHITAGMTEFLVVADAGRSGPAHDLLVSLRIGDEGRWIQAIQDGHVGVYRRALEVIDPKTDVLAVYLRHGSDETVLRFPLSVTPPKP